MNEINSAYKSINKRELLKSLKIALILFVAPAIYKVSQQYNVNGIFDFVSFFSIHNAKIIFGMSFSSAITYLSLTYFSGTKFKKEATNPEENATIAK